MKRTLVFLIALLVAVPDAAHAYDAKRLAPSGQWLYYNVSQGKATVVFPGNDVTSPYTRWPVAMPVGAVTIPDSISYNDVNIPVVAISDHAFWACDQITAISIPGTVDTIGVMSLSCSNLTSVSLSNGVKVIKLFAFSWSNIDSVFFPESVNKIEGGAFAGCSQLARLVVDENNPVFDSRDNCNAIVRTATQTLVLGCKESVIPSSVVCIGDSAFHGCNGLTSIDIPNSVTAIGKYAFAGCSSLTSIDVPNAVISIGNWAFSGCSSLASVAIPSSVTSIGNEAFTNCGGLTSIVVEAGNTVFDSRDNCNAIIRTATNEIVRGCQSTVIPSSVTSIGYMAFSHCSGLTSVTIPGTITSIGQEAFHFCSNLATVTIPSSVTSIGTQAFYYCNNLTAISIHSTTPPTLGYNVFSSTNNCDLYVPCGAVGAYQSATHWSEYASRISERPFLPYSYSFTTNNHLMGTVAATDADCDSNVTVTATAGAGYQFVGWSDGGAGNPRTFHLTQDTLVVALFCLIPDPDTVYVHDTTYVDVPYAVHDTTYIDVPYAVHDTTYVDVPYAVHDTTYVDVPYAVHDTTYIDVPYAVHDTTYIVQTDTGYINVTVYDTVYLTEYDTVTLTLHDTTVVTDTLTLTEYVPVHDTTYLTAYEYVHDTAYIDVPYAVHDTTVVTDTLTLTEYVDVYVHDTTYLTEYEYVHDTTYITLTDTVTQTVYDTTVVDNYIHDTTLVTDTLWLTDTIYFYDTVYIHDTVYVPQEGIGDAEAMNVKLYQRDGKIVVEGAEGMTVRVYDDVGRQVYAPSPSLREGTTVHTLAVPASGVYLVRVGTLPARRIVVVRK